ncbi:MAG: hypothetical protein ACKO6K_06425 [Chitinophagaceae bacterium]
MSIVFVHNQKAFLPELEAYQRFFSARGIECHAVTPEEVQQYAARVEWYFMGTDLSRPKPGVLRIHEYCSASVAPFRKLKDFFKSFVNTQPDFRIFQNEFVRQSFYFQDSIPYGFRDMGIPEAWLQPPVEIKKDIDFIYIGQLHDPAQFRGLIRNLQHALPDSSLLILSREYHKLAREFSTAGNIQFIGPLAHAEVRTYLMRARYALNWVPDEAPYNQQSSTKLLEYLSCRIPVISNRYPWVTAFEKQSGGRFFFVNNDWSNVSREAIGQFPYVFPDLSSMTWERQIQQCAILPVLQKIFPGLA